ncbi:hypothetical protein [Methanotorris formicicus]|uniref:hypothetical protein n=1 Tax=Methanotorris formicicus TaxID=213185 RepID=UPI001145AACC|nr:hypothetical protein [Methanotorris formicicus]
MVYLGETYVGETALVILSGLVMSGEYYLLNEINKYMDVEIPVTVKYGENTYNPRGFEYKTTYYITYRDLYYSLPKCPSFYYLVLMPIKNNKKVTDTALTGAIGESVAVVVFEDYYHYKVIPNWEQFWGGADFSITKGSIWNPWDNWYNLEAKGTMSTNYISKRLRDGHDRNLKGGSGYVTCYCIPTEELYVGYYN